MRTCMSVLHLYRDGGLWVHGWPRGSDACCCVSDHVTLVGDDIGLFEDHGQVIRHEGLSVIVNGNHFGSFYNRMNFIMNVLVNHLAGI